MATTERLRFLLAPARDHHGSDAHPLSREQHLAKFRRCWTYGAHPLKADNCERLIGLVDGLETMSDVRELTALTVP